MSSLTYNFPELQEPQNTVLVKCSKNGEIDTSLHKTLNLSVYKDCVITTVKPRKTGIKPKKTGRSGAPVSMFSRKSRKAMMTRLAQIRDNASYFITLTYPGLFDRTKEEIKRDIANLRRILEYHYPDHGAMWRLELKVRKSGESEGKLVPHYHILIFGLLAPDLREFRLLVATAWTRIVTGECNGSEFLRTQVQPINNYRHACAYVSKYASKEETLEDDENDSLKKDFQGWGRRWGLWGELDTTELITVEITVDENIEIRRLIRGLLRSKGNQYHRRITKQNPYYGFTAFGAGDSSLDSWIETNEATILRIITSVVQDIASLSLVDS